MAKLMDLLLIAALAWASVPAARADSVPEGTDDGPFLDQVDVNVVNVDVYVTDKKGNHITGLSLDDFELEVDKQPVKITNFYAVEGGTATSGGEIQPIEQPQVDRNLDEVVDNTPEEQRLHLIVYVDNFNLHPFTRNRVLANLRTFLRTRLDRGDRVMLVTYDRSLHVRHPFTSDPEIIASALFDLEELSAHAVHYDSNRRDMLDQIQEAEDIYDVQGRAAQYAESIFSDMSFTLDAIKQMVENLAGLPGRKAVLYVSDGLSMRAGEDVFHAMSGKFPDASSVLLDSLRYDLTRRFTGVTNQANANRVSFYTLEAAGLRTYTYMDASNATFSNNAARVDQVHFSNLQNSLRFMADETGGMAMFNTNNYTPLLNRMADDFENYYSLGFSPGAADSGRYRRIEVKVKDRKKLIVRHRDGYREKPMSTRMADGTLAALHFGYQKNPLNVQLEVGETIPHQDSGHYVVSVAVKIPIGGLSFLDRQDVHLGRVRLFIGSKDDEGGLAPIQDVPVPIEIPAADFASAQEQYYRYELKLVMRRGAQVLAVGFRDEVGAVTGFVARNVRVGA